MASEPLSSRSTMVAWICRRCGLGLVCDDEPGNCGCWRPGDSWDYDRLEVVAVDALLSDETLEAIDEVIVWGDVPVGFEGAHRVLRAAVEAAKR